MTGIKLWKGPQPGARGRPIRFWELAISSVILNTNQPTKPWCTSTHHPLEGRLSKLHLPISISVEPDQWVTFFASPILADCILLGQLVPSCGSPACGSSSYAGQPALGGRIHQQPRQTIRPDETLSSAAPTLRCRRWNIIIVRVKNDPGATGAWWNYCHRSKPPIRVWPLIFRTNFCFNIFSASFKGFQQADL